MDHDRVNIRTSTISCGVMEISGITDVPGALYQIATRLYHPSRGEPCAFMIWSDVYGKENNSLELSVLIQKMGFGSMTVSHVRQNPRTGNDIIVYTWGINHEPFKKWYAEERVKKLKKVGT